MIERQEKQETGEALDYIILPAYETAIPKTGNTQETIASFLVNQGDFQTESNPDSFPCVSKRILANHFPAYAILPVLRTVTTSFPERMETFLERSTRRQRESIIRAGIQKDKARFERRREREKRGLIDVSDIF